MNNFQTNWEAIGFLFECNTAEELKAGGVDVVKILRHALSILEGLKELDYRNAWEANWYSAPICLRAEFDNACRAFNEQLFTKEAPGIFCDALSAYLEGESLAEAIEQGGSKKKSRSL